MSTETLHFENVAGQIVTENSTFPEILVNKSDLQDVTACATWIKQNQQSLEKHLRQSGALLFRGFPIDSAEAFDEFSVAFGYPNFTYKESLSNAVRINFTKRVFTANEAPKDVEIFLHHEMAQTPISPSKLFFYCHSAADQGGATPLCRSDMLFAEFQRRMPEEASAFISKGLKYTTHMPAENDHESGQGRSWKSTLSVEDKQQAEIKLQELGYAWHWGDDDSLHATTPVLPAVIDIGNEQQVFYNQLIAAYMGWKGVKEDPSSAITFGDDSAISIAALDLIVELSEKYTFDLPWQDGDVALVDNYMTMHGRRPFSGDRKRQVLVVLAAD